MTDGDDSKSLKVRFGLWVHRVFLRLGLIEQPWQNKKQRQADQSTNQSWEARWEIFRIGLLTTSVLLLIDVVVVIGGWLFLHPSETVILLGTLLLLAMNAAVGLWIFDRMKNARRERGMNI